MHSNSTEVVKQNGYGHEAVKQSGEALHYAAAELSMDREIILEAVKKDWDASQSAAEWFRADLDIVLGAVKQKL